MTSRPRLIPASFVCVLSVIAIVRAEPRQRLNHVVELLEQKQPVFGVYWPTNPSGRGRAGAPPPAAVPPKPPADLAREALAYRAADFLFSGALEGGMDRGIGPVTDFVKATADAGAPSKTPLPATLIVKAPKIGADTAKAAESISRALNLGVSGLMFVEVESADEVRAGLAAMRFKSNGGTRPDDVGDAPAYWGMTAPQYQQKADLWPGAGTLRGVFSTTNAAGERVVVMVAWENAIQQVLAACKEFKVPCGFPANANDIELRMKQGFSVFVMNWGDAGFKAVETGRKAAGR